MLDDVVIVVVEAACSVVAALPSQSPPLPVFVGLLCTDGYWCCVGVLLMQVDDWMRNTVYRYVIGEECVCVHVSEGERECDIVCVCE